MESEEDMNFDFTRLTIQNADGPSVPIDNRAASASGCDVRAFFGNLEEQLVAAIASADFVVGCVAWLTNREVLKSLAAVDHGCQLVVQKEDWLRPDLHTSRADAWKRDLRELYDDLRCDVDRYSLCSSCSMPTLSAGLDIDEEPVRCAGNHNSTRVPAFPRMHHKFFVLCDAVDDGVPVVSTVVPRAVWTGSFNPTANGTRSRENAVLISSGEIASRYMLEWFNVYAISEPLDWESDWCEPQYRIGT
jgi:hypothetical protein